MELKYSTDKGTQIVLSLLKEHGISKVIASPGTTNVALVGSMMYDKWFEMYSSVDERSAAYMACGLAAESGEPVVITCTGATASRNYFPALTEAYYRKLPILVIAGSHGEEKVGHLHAQTLDRSQSPHDTIIKRVSIDKILDEDQEWKTIVDVNDAILTLRHRGGGPVLINLREATMKPYTAEQLPKVRVIRRYNYEDGHLPPLAAMRIAIFIGAHRKFTEEEQNAIEHFCETNNAVVFCDHTSGYYGKYRIQNALIASQTFSYTLDIVHPDLLIHLGEVSGDAYELVRLKSKETWRVNEDGGIKDLFRNLTNVFEMSVTTFFNSYTKSKAVQDVEYYEACRLVYNDLYGKLPELPYSNVWVASKLHKVLPTPCVLHMGILNSLRSWNFFELPNGIETSCNVGGFGIDGPISTIVGASLAHKDKLHFLVVGDLAFFYDLNALGNRHITNNLRILLVNNGRGIEFRQYDHTANQWGNDADLYMAAGGHFGKQSPTLVKDFVSNMGFKYLSARTKNEFENVKREFVDENSIDKPILLEVFTTPENERDAIQMIKRILPDERSMAEKIIGKVKSIIG